MTEIDQKKDLDNFKNKFGWLADAPLFIDADLINRFYDAVVMPQVKLAGGITYKSSEQNINKDESQIDANVGIKLDTGKLSSILAALGPIMPSFNKEYYG